MRGGEVKVQRATEGEACLEPANQRMPASRCPQGPASIVFAPHWADLPLPKPFRGTILASKPPGIGQISVETDGGVFRIRDDEPVPRIGAGLHRAP
jgi:hypothetical protein